MELTKKSVFSTKESLKWGFILVGVGLLIPLVSFGFGVCGENYTDYIEWHNIPNDYWRMLCFNIGDKNNADIDRDIVSHDIGFLWLKTSETEQFKITKIEPNPWLRFRLCFDNSHTNCEGWNTYPSYYINDFPSENDEIVYSSQSIKDSTGTIIYTSEFLEEQIRVFGVSPESSSTITDIDADFIIGWENWDFEWVYKDFVFSFQEKNTGILTGTMIYAPETETGTTTLKFSDFGIDKNGKYYFHAKARSYLYEYTAYYTGDLVSPEWWVNIQVEGWTPIFEMPVFETWYSEHSKFATSTAIFSGVANLLSPIYNKIGEFGDRVVAFLNLDEAYDRGFELGKIIPTFRHYVGQIEMFFGGFPIIQIFLAFLVILLGIFIVRLILKFIPGLG